MKTINIMSYLEWNTIALLIIFIITSLILYLNYDILDNESRANESRANEAMLHEIKILIIQSDEAIDKLEKFSDLQTIVNDKGITGDFTLDTSKSRHNKYNQYFIDNSIECIADKNKDENVKNDTKIITNMNAYNKALNSYMEEINFNLLSFFQKNYKDAHNLNTARQYDLEDIDSLPGKFM